MDMFEVKIYDHDMKLLRRSLIQAVCRDKALIEAKNVFIHTPGAHKYSLD